MMGAWSSSTGGLLLDAGRQARVTDDVALSTRRGAHGTRR